MCQISGLSIHQDSLEYFGERRTDKSRSSKFQGVETPSQVGATQSLLGFWLCFRDLFKPTLWLSSCGPQSRYVGYYEIMKTKFNRQLPVPKSLKIKSIRIHSIGGKTFIFLPGQLQSSHLSLLACGDWCIVVDFTNLKGGRNKAVVKCFSRGGMTSLGGHVVPSVMSQRADFWKSMENNKPKLRIGYFH